ncbi:5352_t:CDS:2 [Paraglomus brasilianum]|uniref:5352_t:CDS:1 n=1 Tax=Paraglomus brasilianum TaxID=144538 RepID=A0A9N9BPL9_9GLOM|nr:5352_t:CDS:2 [Paraglomus brasilianum]
MEIYSPSKGTEERTRLYKDFHEELSELKEVYGIRHNTDQKEERQNNPEIDMINLGEHQAEMMLQEQVESLEEEKRSEQSEQENKEAVEENATLLVKEK